MQKLLVYLLHIVVALSVLEAKADDADFDVQAFIKKVDEVRIPSTDFSVEVVIETKSGGNHHSAQYDVMLNAQRDAIVKTTYPPTERGQVMLMKGKDFWVYLPNVDQPVRLSLSQRLTGQVSNGDIARMSFKEDYRSTLIRVEEDVDGKKAAVLELRGAGEWVTYEKIILWADIHNARPIKAEFYTSSGILLKTCSYERYDNLAGAQRPTRLTFTNPIKGGESSVLTYGKMTIRKIPNKYFNKDYMKRVD